VPDWDPASFTKSLLEDMRAHGGTPSTGPMAGQTLLLLTTTGTRTGQLRQSIVNYHRDGDDLVIAASKGGAPTHPAWFHNLVADPEVSIEVDNEVRRVRAEIAAGAERDRLWSDHVALLPQFAAYPAKTERVIPMIRLQRID
jgi:deazaflavin-dependent oxidoreductase (nitroreductase family)